MRYLLLIGGDEKILNDLPEPQLSARHQAWGTYASDLAAANKLRGGERLRPIAPEHHRANPCLTEPRPRVSPIS